MARLNKWDARHLKNAEQYAKQIEAIYQAAVREAAAIGASVPDFSPDKPFSFADYPSTKARIEKLLKTLQARVNAVVTKGIDAEWALANEKNDELCDAVCGGILFGEQQRRYYSTNDAARRAFTQRKTAGLNLSDRVWRYTDQFKAEIEMGLDLGLRDGLSADEMSRQIRQYLREPERLFRRVRDEHGQLHLSKRAAAYHPGAGVYRSSYKNARRLAATETNLAYRTADHTRWQQLDFVVGIEIRLSNNHPEADVCDTLAGRYPKEFKFTGWHPLCRCHAIAILKTPEEMAADNERIISGEPLDGESVNRVKDVPDNFKVWIAQNDGRIASADARGTLPYFLKENRKVWASLSSVRIINREAIGRTMRCAEEFDARSQALAASLGVRVTPVNIKREGRILEKAINDYQGDVSRVCDMVRNTFIASATDLGRVLAAVHERFRVIRYKAQRTELGYSGHLFQVWVRDGVKAEIQVNTPQMIYAKEPAARTLLGKELYERIRRASGLPCGRGHTYYEEYRALLAIEKPNARQLKRMAELVRLSRAYYKKIESVVL